MWLDWFWRKNWRKKFFWMILNPDHSILLVLRKSFLKDWKTESSFFVFSQKQKRSFRSSKPQIFLHILSELSLHKKWKTRIKKKKDCPEKSIENWRKLLGSEFSILKIRKASRKKYCQSLGSFFVVVFLFFKWLWIVFRVFSSPEDQFLMVFLHLEMKF